MELAAELRGVKGERDVTAFSSKTFFAASACVLVACSSTPGGNNGGSDAGDSGTYTPTTDGGGKPDAKDSGNNNNLCPTPQDVSMFKPATLTPPNGKHQNKCTPTQLADYKACVNGDMAKCAQFQKGMPGESCVNCIETDKTAMAWGPLVVDGMNASINVEGCLVLALNDAGPSSCGQLLHDSYGCQDLACADVCAGDDMGFQKCVDTSLKTNCKSYGDKFDMACGAKIDGDAAPPEASACFQGMNEPALDWQMRVTTYFCGP